MASYLQNLIDRQVSGKFASTRPCYAHFTTESSHGGTLSCNPDGLVNPPFACRFSTVAQHGHLLALADEEGFVTILDTSAPLPQSLFVDEAWGAHPPPRAQWLAHTNAIFDLCWVLDDTCILTASGDQAIGLWHCGNATAYARFQGHSASVKALGQHPDNPCLFASGSRDGSVLLWDQRTNASGRDANNINIHSPVLCIKGAAHGAQGRPLARPSRRSTPRGSSQRPRRALEPCTSVTSVCFLRSGWALLTGGAGDDVVRFYDVRKAGTPCGRAAPGAPLPGAPLLAATAGDDPAGECSRHYGVTSIAEDLQGSRIVVSYVNNVHSSFSSLLPHKGPLSTFGEPSLGSFYVKSAMCPEGTHLLAGGADNTARVWQVDAYEHGQQPPAYALHGHDSEVTCVAWCPTEPCKVATCGDDCTVRVWHVEAPAPASPPRRTSRRHALQPLNNTAALATPAPRAPAARACTPSSGQHLQTPASQVVGSAARRQTASQATIQRSLLDFVTATKTTAAQGASEACSTNLVAGKGTGVENLPPGSSL